MQKFLFIILSIVALTKANAQLVLDPTSKLVIDSNSVVSVSGDVDVNNNIYGTGKLFTGSPAAQSINLHGHFVPRLEIANTLGVTLADSLRIIYALTFNSSDCVFNTMDKLILCSSDTATAAVGDLTQGLLVVGGGIFGKITVERYIPSNNHAAWRLITAPFSSNAPTIYNSWQEQGQSVSSGTFIFQNGGAGTNGFDASGATVSSTILSWNNSGFAQVTNTNANKVTDNNGGYFINTSGNRNLNPLNQSTTSNTTLRATGNITQGNVTINGSGNGAEFSLIRNPYPAIVDYEKTFSDHANTSRVFYVWDANLNTSGAFRTIERTAANTYVATPTTSNDNLFRYIQSGQAFFIAGNTSFNFSESMKTDTIQTLRGALRIGSQTEQIVIDLLKGGVTSTTADGVKEEYNNSSSNSVDGSDVLKMPNINETLSILRSSTDLSVEKRKLIDDHDTIFLKLTNTLPGNYGFAITPSNFDPAADLVGILKDKFTHATTTVFFSGEPTNYNFSVTGDPNSAASDRFMIVMVTLPKATVAGTATVCQNSTTQISFTGSLGTPPYTFTYNINGGTATTVTTQGSSVTATVNASTSQPGIFSYNLLSVQDANISNVQSGSATITVKPLPTATIAGTATVCQNTAPAPIITFTGATGAAPYTFTYKINGSVATATTVAGNTITVTQSTSAAGTFTYTLVSVGDANGCSQAQTGTVTVKVNPLPTASVSGNAIVCQLSPAVPVTFQGITGTAPFVITYKINAGTATTVTTIGNTATVTQSTVAGTFTYTLVSVSDANGCTQAQTGTVTVIIVPKITGLLGSTNTSCNGNNTGSINVFNVAGGIPPYTFSNNGINYISQPSGGPTFTNLPAGIYNITVKDALGCTWALGTSTITQPAPISYSVSQGASINCNNPVTTLTVTAAGGSGNYTYSIDGGAAQNGNVFTTGMGTHNITLTDAAGCSSSTTITVNGTSTVSFSSVNVTNNTCYKGISGQVAVRATGAGTITYTLTAPGGAQTTQSAQSGTTVTFTTLAAGNYTITAADNTNCPVTTIASVSQPAMVMAPDNSNGSPDLLLTSVINPATATFSSGSIVTITYTISVKNNSNISAQGVIIRITKPFSGYLISTTGNAWTKITDNSSFSEFQLKTGLEIPCSGGMLAAITITRSGNDSPSQGLPLTATVRMPGSNPDNHDQDNARSSQFRVQ